MKVENKNWVRETVPFSREAILNNYADDIIMHRNTTITTTDATRTIRWSRRMGWTSQRQRWWLQTTHPDRNVKGYVYLLGTILHHQGKEPGQRDTMKNRGRLGGMPNTGISSKATLSSAWRNRCTTHVCCQLWHMDQRPGHWPNKHRTNLQPYIKIERSMLNITYKDIMTNIWTRERTNVIDMKTIKWCLAGHINRLKDDRWASRVSTRGYHYDKKRRQGRPANRWRDS